VDSLLFFSPLTYFTACGSGRDEEPARRCPPPDSDPCSDAQFGKNLVRLSRRFSAISNRRFQFRKSSQLFIGVPFSETQVRHPEIQKLSSPKPRVKIRLWALKHAPCLLVFWQHVRNMFCQNHVDALHQVVIWDGSGIDWPMPVIDPSVFPTLRGLD
jgi:hypothetical protein